VTETDDAQLRRLRLRSWRRGTREMDLILGPFADATLGELGTGQLAGFEELLEEDDQDLYGWVSGRARAPEAHSEIVKRIRAFHGIS